MVNSCEIFRNGKPCEFWDGKTCIDGEVFIDNNDGDYCCRHHPNAVTELAYKYRNLTQADLYAEIDRLAAELKSIEMREITDEEDERWGDLSGDYDCNACNIDCYNDTPPICKRKHLRVIVTPDGTKHVVLELGII
jgi:hypothetical protein